jgi:signal transduction histidine kinase
VFSRRIRSADGKTEGLMAVIRDASSEKGLAAQKTRFVSNAAHELRTPIANLKTRLYLMRKQPEKLDDHLQVVEQVVQKMQTLIEEMFDFSQLERGTVLLERQDVVLQDLLNEVINDFQARAERRKLALTCELTAEKLVVFADARRIGQMITNLVYSAMNHTREGGFVRMTLQADPPETSPRYATISITDNGVGIPQDLLAQVFQPFSLAKHGDISSGTAIGLTLSKEIVELHGGQISAESEIGKGTTFTVRLLLVENG